MLSNLILHNPLEDELPNDPVDRIHRLARDLAWGALNNLWDARVEIRRDKIQPVRGVKGAMLESYLKRWGDSLPSPTLLIAFGYLDDQHGQTPSGTPMIVGSLTMAAFSLLKSPVRAPEVYISYSRESSSALALLTVARLQMAGVPNPFIDMNLNPGDTVHAEQEYRVRRSDYLVCLIAPGTLNNDYVQMELGWAFNEHHINVIPVWHGGFAPPHDYPPRLAARNAIRITEESTEAYNTAMIRLLNRLGYAP